MNTCITEVASHPTSTCMWYKLKDLGQEVAWQEDMTRVLLYTSFYSSISHVSLQLMQPAHTASRRNETHSLEIVISYPENA